MILWNSQFQLQHDVRVFNDKVNESFRWTQEIWNCIKKKTLFEAQTTNVILRTPHPLEKERGLNENHDSWKHRETCDAASTATQ